MFWNAVPPPFAMPIESSPWRLEMRPNRRLGAVAVLPLFAVDTHAEQDEHSSRDPQKASKELFAIRRILPLGFQLPAGNLPCTVGAFCEVESLL